MADIVILSADRDVAASLELGVRPRGHTVTRGGPATLPGADVENAGLVILAPHPGADLDALCQAVRSRTQAPLLVVVCTPDEADELAAFSAGADDVIQSPFSRMLVAARVEALLRRAGNAPARPCTHFGGALEIDPNTRLTRVHGQPVTLTPTEFDLLWLLATNTRRVLRRAEIIAAVWGQWPGDDHLLEVHLSRLRAKILKAGGPRVGHAISGVGYTLGAELVVPAPS